MVVRRTGVPPVVPWDVYQDLLDKYDGLVKELLALKREHFVTPPDPSQLPVAPSLPDVVQEAIAAIAPSDPQLAHQLTGTAWNLLGQHVEPAEVAQRILEGEEVSL